MGITGCATYCGTLDTPDIKGTVVEFGTRKPLADVLIILDRSMHKGNYIGMQDQTDKLLGISHAFSGKDGSFIIPGFSRQLYNDKWMRSDYTWYGNPRIVTAFGATYALHERTPDEIIILNAEAPIRLFLTANTAKARSGIATLPTYLRGPRKLTFAPEVYPQLLLLLEAWYAAEHRPGGPPAPADVEKLYKQYTTRITKYFDKEAKREAAEAEAAKAPTAVIEPTGDAPNAADK